MPMKVTTRASWHSSVETNRDLKMKIFRAMTNNTTRTRTQTRTMSAWLQMMDLMEISMMAVMMTRTRRKAESGNVGAAVTRRRRRKRRKRRRRTLSGLGNLLMQTYLLPRRANKRATRNRLQPRRRRRSVTRTHQHNPSLHTCTLALPCVQNKVTWIWRRLHPSGRLSAIQTRRNTNALPRRTKNVTPRKWQRTSRLLDTMPRVWRSTTERMTLRVMQIPRPKRRRSCVTLMLRKGHNLDTCSLALTFANKLKKERRSQ
mmetsp:Transcript_20843/g.40880  ORF Transcript_20843/g.40880 Transcript_20843/m.40880 type:complete len:259 (+) Transcript_20843:440-1216(+)